MKYAYAPLSGPASDAYDPHAVTREPFPAPLRGSRDPASLEWYDAAPNPVLALAQFAREHSWEVRAQSSQGYVPHGTTGRPGALKDMIGLRFGLHPMTDRQAYAVYSRNAAPAGEWTWSSVMIWGPDLKPYAGCGLNELKAYLIMCADSSAEALAQYVEDLKYIASNAEALKKRRDAFRKKIRATYNAMPLRAWPAALLESWVALHEARGIYEMDDLIKIIERTRTTEKEGRR